MRYRTVSILCFALVLGMFGLPAIVWAVFLPSLQQGLPNPIPGYERSLLEIAVLCDHWKWLLAFPTLGLGLTLLIVGTAGASRKRK